LEREASAGTSNVLDGGSGLGAVSVAGGLVCLAVEELFFGSSSFFFLGMRIFRLNFLPSGADGVALVIHPLLKTPDFQLDERWCWHHIDTRRISASGIEGGKSNRIWFFYI
jgi:hypothetical protein